MNLDSAVSEIPFVGPSYENKLKKLGVEKIDDLLRHVPHRFLDFTKSFPVASARVGETLTLKGEITFIKNQYTKRGRKMQIAGLKDQTGEITLVWFNQPYLIRVIFPGDKVAVAGKIDWFGRTKALLSPELEKLKKDKATLHTGRLVPVYPETSGLSSKWLRSRIKNCFEKVKPTIKDYLPLNLLKENSFVDLKTAFRYIHFPENETEAVKGRERLAFDELLLLQLFSLARKAEWQKHQVRQNFILNKEKADLFLKKLPFKLTSSQKKAIGEILADLGKEQPMNRLLEGDVGSGKTIVSAVGAYASFLTGFQSVYMAPTQILAQQHFETLKKLFHPFGLKVLLVTSETKTKDIKKADLFVGTHALLFKEIPFEKVGYVVIDEQHRFGVEQRNRLVSLTGKKSLAPHVLTMTATPIPRTIALSFYGDLDLSVLTEMPKGRLPIKTIVVTKEKRAAAYNWIKEVIKKEKIQVFVVCPLIEESDTETLLNVRSVLKEYESLKAEFKGFKLGLLHGRLSVKDKNSVLNKFKKGSIDLLVTTPVVEVGIDVPNASIMLIEGADRFGLSQLHQLRGRVGRGKKKSYCLLFPELKSVKIMARLSAMEKGLSGFELSELDLKLRGPGEIFGLRQHGFPELKIASWLDITLIKKAKKAAGEALAKPNKYSALLNYFHSHPIHRT